MKIKSIRILAIDAGERLNTLKLTDNITERTTVITFDELKNLPLQDSILGIDNSHFKEIHIVMEGAHAAPRRKHSLSQILEGHILESLIDNCNSTDNFKFMVLSEKLTSRALTHYQYNYDASASKDTHDGIAIIKLIEDFPEIQLKKIKSAKDLYTKDRVEDGRQWRLTETNPDMNYLQALNYGLIKKGEYRLELDLVPVIRDIILETYPILYKSSSPIVKKFFLLTDPNVDPENEYALINNEEWLPHIDKHRNLIDIGIQKKRKIDGKLVDTDPFIKSVDWSFEMRGLSACLNAICDSDGHVRSLEEKYMHEGRISNNWIKDFYFVHNQFHHQGGVPRAILMNYLFPAFHAKTWVGENKDDKWLSWHKGIKNRGKLNEKQNKHLVLTRKQGKDACMEVINFYRNILGIKADWVLDIQEAYV